MKLHRDVTNLNAIKPVVTIGMFDGVHLGHQSLLKNVIERAKAIGGESVVLTFWPHPRILFEGEKSSLRFLTTIEEKVSIMKKIGVNHVIVYPFTHEFANIEPTDFVKIFLLEGTKAHTVIVGHDHRFGHNGQGDYELLSDLGWIFDFKTEQVSALDISDTHVSSTKIREALIAGDIIKANLFLSYEYSITGTVVKGNQIGRTMGFPTANIQPDEKHKQIPGNGVYITEVEIQGKTYKAVANVGNRPTIVNNQPEPNIEAFILDFTEEIYFKPITIRFKGKIRDEMKFGSVEFLKEKIEDDVTRTRSFFEKSRVPIV